MIDKSKFNSKDELIKYIVENKREIIDLKKSSTKECDCITVLSKQKEVNKSIDSPTKPEDDEEDEITRTIIGNTYNWMDSHDDVHIEGIFTKSIKERGNKVLHLHDHIWQLGAKVGSVQKVYEDKISWVELGILAVGETMALMMDSVIKKSYDPKIFEMYKNNEIDQHSVGMIYINLFLCVNNAEYKEEFAAWNKYFPVVSNKQKAIDNGFFFAVTEAKLKEISCVIEGSNELTPVRMPSQKGTLNIEPSEKDTQKDNFVNYFIKNFNIN